MANRACQHRRANGQICGATPLTDRDLCFWHAPENREEAAEARRLGGLRRRKERTVSGAFEVEGLASVGSIRRLLEIAVLDTLGLESSISRSRTLGYLALSAARLLEVGELEQRLAALEGAVQARPAVAASPFDIEMDDEGEVGNLLQLEGVRP